MPDKDIAGFEQFDFASGGALKTVYWKGQGKPVLVMHELPGLKSDRICVAGKLDRLREAFGDRLEEHQLDSPGFGLRSPHAVLTEEYDKARDAGPEHPTRIATARVIEFLRERLG